MTTITPPLSQLLQQPVVPVLAFDAPQEAIAICAGLVDEGLRVLELTLRTARALEVVAAVRAEVTDAVVAVGTVLDGAQARAAVAAGGELLFSPGGGDELMDVAATLGVTLIPGVATATESMAARARGLRLQKFFPAEASGGAAALRALAGPLPDVTFCPTGGVSEARLGEYLQVANVACVGGSWLVTREDLAAGDVGAVRARARRALAMASEAGWSPRADV